MEREKKCVKADKFLQVNKLLFLYRFPWKCYKDKNIVIGVNDKMITRYTWYMCLLVISGFPFYCRRDIKSFSYGYIYLNFMMMKRWNRRYQKFHQNFLYTYTIPHLYCWRGNTRRKYFPNTTDIIIMWCSFLCCSSSSTKNFLIKL